MDVWMAVGAFVCDLFGGAEAYAAGGEGGRELGMEMREVEVEVERDLLWGSG